MTLDRVLIQATREYRLQMYLRCRADLEATRRSPMPRYASFAVAVLALMLPPHGQGDERPKGDDRPGLGLPPLTGDDAVGVDVHDLNIALRNQYRELAK